MNFTIDANKPIPSIARTILRGLEANPSMKFVGDFRRVQETLHKSGIIAREEFGWRITAQGQRLLEDSSLRTEEYRNAIPE